MRPSVQQLVSGIAQALHDQVLPELPPASWPASQVRGCLIVLAHLQARLEQEQAIVVADNDALHELLVEACDYLSQRRALPALLRSLRKVLKLHGKGHGPLLSSVGSRDALQHALNQLIEAVHDPNAKLPPAGRRELTRKIRNYLNAAAGRESALFEKTMRMSPL